jgi:DNA polymerase-3 subunit alpha
MSLFDEEQEAEMDTFTMHPMEDWELKEKLETEKELLGFYISGHPMDAFKQAIKERVTVNTAKSEQLPFGKTTNIIAMVTGMRPYTTKKGSIMCFLQLTDMNATFDATLFPKSYELFKDTLNVDGIYGFTGKFDNSRGIEKVSFLIDQVYTDPYELAPVAVSACHIEIDKPFCTNEQVTELRDTCLSYGGLCSLELVVLDAEESTRSSITCGREFSVRFCEDFVSEVKKIPAVQNIWFD